VIPGPRNTGPSFGTGWGVGNRRSKIQRGAARWLSALLAAGPVAARDVADAATRAGFSHQSLLRAKARAGVLSQRIGRRFVWKLPPTLPG